MDAAVRSVHTAEDVRALGPRTRDLPSEPAGPVAQAPDSEDRAAHSRRQHTLDNSTVAEQVRVQSVEPGLGAAALDHLGDTGRREPALLAEPEPREVRVRMSGAREGCTGLVLSR